MVTHSWVYITLATVSMMIIQLFVISPTSYTLLIDHTFTDLRNVSNETDRNVFFPNYLQTS